MDRISTKINYRLLLILSGLLLLYPALGVIIYWFFNFKIPFEPHGNGMYPLLIGVAVIFIMPVIGFLLVKKSKTTTSKLLGIFNLISFVLVVVRIVTTLN